jgi:redox-sensitive bicupin YhaK (pirin superfamily)
VPASHENGVAIRLYSGTLAGLVSPIQNYTPIIIADIGIEAGVTTTLQLPANFNTLLYVLQDSVKAGQNEKSLRQDQLGWLDLTVEDKLSDLQVTAGDQGVRFVLYAGKPTGESIISYGPFIGDTSSDIDRLLQDCRQGKLKHIASVPQTQRIAL